MATVISPPAAPPQEAVLAYRFAEEWEEMDMLAQSAIIALIGVLALLLIFMLFASPSRLHKCCCFRRAPRRAVGVKAENRFDGMLFFWIIVHLAISAAWLRLIPQGDQYGRGITYPLWLEDRPARFVSDDALQPTIEGFRMVTVEDSCDYNLKHTDKDYCGDKNPVVPVLATIDRVDNINMGLVMTVHSSGDFGWWQQSSTVVLPRDLAANRTVDVSNYTTTLFDPSFEAKLQSDGLAISSKACFGAPGAYYVVGCLRTGIPPNVGKRPQCSAPPCPGTVGPPFSSCLAIATACVSTCGSLATETKVPSKCINGSVPFHEIEKFAQPFGVLDPPFIGFIICYAVGLIYFFVMYMPGVGMDPYDREVEMLDMAEDFAAQPPRPLASPRFALNPSPRQSHCTSQTSSRSLRNFSLRGPARPSLAQGAQGNPVYPAHMPSGLSHFGASSYAVRSRRASAMTNASSDEAPVIITRAPTAKSETSDGRSSPAIAGQVLEPVPSAASMPSSDPSIKGEAGEAEADLDVEGQGLLTDEQVAPAPMPTIASNRAMGRGAWGNNPRANLSGCTAVSFSISAGEGPNTILRNALGKICASLELAKNIKQTPGWQIVDGFADEGHRIGAYYLCRATWLAFYNAMHPTVALKVASSWLDAMNEHEHASNIDKFDKEKQTDLFALLSSSDLARPEICYVRFFFKLFRALNGFTVPVDDLFEYALTMPFCNSSEYSKAFEHIRERTSADEHLGVDELLETMISATSIQSTAHARVILNACLVSSKAPLSAPKSAPATAPTAGEDTDSTTAQPEAAESCTFSLETLMHDGLRAHARAEAAAAGFDPADVEDEEDEEDAVAISFFSPEFVREFGMLLGGELKGRYHPQGDLKVPLDTAAYVTCLSKLQGEPLGCDAFQSLSQTLLRPTLAKLQLSTRKRWLAYDHVGILPAPAGGGTTAIYIARARPDLWKPETKEDHRRRIEAGVWGCRTPADDSDAEFWQARRELCLVHGVAPAAASYGPPPRTLAEREQHDEIYDDDDDDGEVVGHFFADLLSYYAAGGAEGTMGGVAEGVGRKRLSEVKVLNMHLGKAGGLNFGLEAILHSDIVPQPTATHPLFFGIIDARHSCDGRFWKHVMPEFFEVHEIDDQVVFNPNVVLCQLPHSYIGMKASTDKLDVQNNFFFNGMALFRNRCNGMTSCGTGGIWSLTTHENVDDFFFGRTMIEDTTSTHKYFLQGYYSKYIPPLRTSKQLMRAVPKVSANYLEALERWDTGAVQSLLTQGLPRMWFWCTLLFLLALLFAIIAPAFTTGQDVIGALRRPWDPENVFVVFCIFYSAGVLVTVAVGVLVLSAVSPATLNWLLRFLICFFNVTYPFTSIFGLFWMSIPPYVAIMAQFPFRLNAVAAIVGSLVLKMVEFSAMAKLQDASSLDEASIAMTQKMDKVTLPIKLRAIYKGFLTGYADRYHKHDNSFWTSFGTSGALLWVRRWLLLLSSVMSATALIAFIMLIVKATQGLTVFMEVVLPLTFALLTGLHYVWLCYEPFRFVMKGGSLDVAPRWAEVAITVGMLIGLVTIGNMVPRP